ncbi:TPA: proteasome subunit beta [Candidatus Woesearchaeota archaeon]|nr:proteasome subunit beta [Candidatus Woesearchaeota archaeon]HIH05115.1 proteasome subunit beta [Candidatus Woesearchaeota archaeon]HIH91694.1 proteasome subunit beta [Candidatus Woesearchaeota archaeon]HII64169.1 proteasome subunit beta [Candidatus Woesearchaeota archaeon]HII65492.1 proteasome subunit beta [Candidatus Woesearchaeota archaeon]
MDDKQLKTGTTTVALLCKDGIVLAADKRVTSGYLISNKKFEKIFPISESIAVTVAGTVSDIQLLTKYIKAELSLRAIRTGREASVKEAVNLLGMFVYGNIRKYSIIPGVSHFIVAGKDSDGFHGYDISPDGSIIEIDDYTSSGSGSVMAYGVLETLYKPNMSIDEGVKLAVKAINAAVQRDIASGNGVDVIAVTKDGVKKVHSQLLTYKLEA